MARYLCVLTQGTHLFPVAMAKAVKTFSQRVEAGEASYKVIAAQVNMGQNTVLALKVFVSSFVICDSGRCTRTLPELPAGCVPCVPLAQN